MTRSDACWPTVAADGGRCDHDASAGERETLAGLNMERTRARKDRIGALPPRYAFVLNPQGDTKFTKCPRCKTKTNLRKLTLVIHVEGFGLVLLGKTCRLCLTCETLIAHEAELDRLLSTVVKVSIPDYFVLGTADRWTHRRGLAGAASLDDVKAHTSDFKSYWTVDIKPAGWYPRNETGNGQAG
jgi:hypothetical protein